MSCRDSPGLQKFRPGSTLKACSQTQDGQNLGGPRTLFISKDLTGVSLTGTLEGQAAAKGCNPGETGAPSPCQLPCLPLWVMWPPQRDPVWAAHSASWADLSSAKKPLKRPQSTPFPVSCRVEGPAKNSLGKDSGSSCPRQRRSKWAAAPASASDPESLRVS